jgi:hypothetical protein
MTCSTPQKAMPRTIVQGGKLKNRYGVKMIDTGSAIPAALFVIEGGIKFKQFCFKAGIRC